MSNSTSISELYREFTDVLPEVLAENANGPAHRGSSRGSPLSRKHLDYLMGLREGLGYKPLEHPAGETW